MFKKLQDRVRGTLRVVADIAESVGVPPSVTSLLQGNGESAGTEMPPRWGSVANPYRPPPPPKPPEKKVVADDGQDTFAAQKERSEIQKAARARAAQKKRAPVSSKKRNLDGDKSKSADVRALEVDDAIDGSTYLARIVWCLGVAEREGTGALRPADMARMIMSRSPVSLEPPNVARYIRRSNRRAIDIARTEGSSHYYSLNDEGKQLFKDNFVTNKS